MVTSIFFFERKDKMEYKNIKDISEIDFTNGDNIKFLASVISITDLGDGQTRPIKAVLKLEESGENVIVTTWKHEYLDNLKLLTTLDSVYSFEGRASLYKEKDKQIRIETMHDAGIRSSKKVIKELNITGLKSEINTIIENYISKNSIYRVFLKTLLQDSEKFYIWPAATTIHHAYEGGLAKHSLGVCKNAISIWKNYSGSNADIELIVTGALLHDIGKIKEYNQDGSRNIYGNLLGHSVIGADRIFRVALENNLDPETNIKIIMLRNLILSHHGKLEFGAPVMPGSLEAEIVSRADDLDARMEAGDKALDLIDLNKQTNNICSLDNTKLFKWHN